MLLKTPDHEPTRQHAARKTRTIGGNRLGGVSPRAQDREVKSAVPGPVRFRWGKKAISPAVHRFATRVLACSGLVRNPF